MPAPIVVHPRREVPAWERLMPYLTQMASQANQRKARIQEQEIARQQKLEDEERALKRQREFKPKVFQVPITNPDGTKRYASIAQVGQNSFKIIPDRASPAAKGYQNMVKYGKNEKGEDIVLERIAVPPGGPRMDDASKHGFVMETGKSGQTININQGKILPASEVSKLGELAAYKSTVDELNKLVKDDSLKTGGMFEGFLNAWDKYSGLGNEQRQNTRALVARLPGLMYAMRGKQLSDKELEVALKMMPTMDMTPQAFKIALRRFEQYMNQVTEGKIEAYYKAGYTVGGIGEEITGKRAGGGRAGEKEMTAKEKAKQFLEE